MRGRVVGFVLVLQFLLYTNIDVLIMYCGPETCYRGEAPNSGLAFILPET